VAPPSRHATGVVYAWDLHYSKEPAAAPVWLRGESDRSHMRKAPAVSRASTSPYGLAALRSEAVAVGNAPIGTRNHTLNRAALSMGQLVSAGHADLHSVASVLVDSAISSGLTVTAPSIDTSNGRQGPSSPSPASRDPFLT
jgi:hypothetical protein